MSKARPIPKEISAKVVGGFVDEVLRSFNAARDRLEAREVVYESDIRAEVKVLYMDLVDSLCRAIVRDCVHRAIEDAGFAAEVMK